MKLSEKDLFENPTPRVPVCLVLDTSYSMSGPPINNLNQGIAKFYEAIKADDYARYSVEIAIVTFGGTAQKILDFESIDHQQQPMLTVAGGTPMGQALQMATALLEDRIKKYKDVGVDYHQPWLVLMTDGRPTDDVESVIPKIYQMDVDKQLMVFPIGIGAGADMKTLARLSSVRQPLRLKGLKFELFFEWLGNSISNVSSSMPGEKIPLGDEETLKGWIYQ